jgi:hypothetical protein
MGKEDRYSFFTMGLGGAGLNKQQGFAKVVTGPITTPNNFR